MKPALALLAAAFCLAVRPVEGAPAYRPGDEPARHDYRARPADFAAIQDALAGALKVQPKLFPDGIGSVDVVLQDTSRFYVYSRSDRRPWKKIGHWREYNIYTLPHRRPPEHEMWGCAGGPPSVMEVGDRRIIAEHSVRCAPWGSFHAAQVRKRSYYRYREAYLATLIHELGHQYEDMKEYDPTAAMVELSSRAASVPLPAYVDRSLMAGEVFAEYAELVGAQLLYPAHYRRMLADAAGPSARDKYGHHEALRVAVDCLNRPSAR